MRKRTEKIINSLQSDKCETICIYGLTICFFSLAVIRAAIQGITYDEAYTYIHYALPLTQGQFWEKLTEFSRFSLANNHWINTLLISLFTALTGIRWSEFIIRIPVLCFGGIYYFSVAHYKLQNRIGWFEFILLDSSYYLNEFFSLARGYGICCCLVFLGLMQYKEFCKNANKQHLFASVFLLVASAYANSVSLIIVASVASVFIVREIKNRDLVWFLRSGAPLLIPAVIMLCYIAWFHFRVSDISAGMPLYSSEASGLLHYVCQFVFLGTYIDNVPAMISFVLIMLLMIVVAWYGLKKRSLFSEEIGVSFLICLLLLMGMNIVFNRGGLTYRTLLPFYPLAVLGAAELCRPVFNSLRVKFEKNAALFRLLRLSLMIGIMLLNWKSIDFTNTKDWGDSNSIKWKVYSQNYNKDDFSPVHGFYENQREWNFKKMENLEN